MTPDPERELLRLIAGTARGPRRDGTYAVWLTVRVATDLMRGDLQDRAQRRRIQSLEKRLSSLSMPPTLRRGLHGSLTLLADATPESGALALGQLVAPVRDALGPEAADAVRRAGRA